MSRDIIKQLQMWKDKPDKFVQQAFGATPEKWQTKALRSIAANDRVAIKSGHGVGKTAFLAWTIIWWLLTRFPAKIACTAPTSHQLEDVLWSEVSFWHRKLDPVFKDLLTVKSDQVVLNASPSLSFAVARTARKEKPEAFQGFHSPNMLFLIDEASGVDPIIFEVGEGAMSTAGAKTVMTGNPTRTSGYFYDAFNKMRDWWVTDTVGCADSTQATDEYVEQMAQKWGTESNVYSVRVLGHFPQDDDDSIISRALVEASVERDIFIPKEDPVIWGLDVARFGSDKTALCVRKGRKILGKVETWRNKDTMQVAGIIKAKYDKVAGYETERPLEIMVDSIGVGAGVVDRLREMGLPVRGINVAESASIDTLYHRLRDELWYRAKEWFDGKDVTIDNDEDLIEELCAIRYEYTSLGKLKAESKDDMKKRGLPSPDLADAFCLTFANNNTVHANSSWSKKLEYPDLYLP